MSTSILEALKNAEGNLVENRYSAIAEMFGRAQLRNAIVLLEKGYSPHDIVDDLLDKYGSVNDVPEKKQT